ncbi:hypothetical protein [Streptomyces albipurpureus]|uniref:Uncharacterized protein n=1 Tax=Streptomyces albipurpureus TaxID=2897419 RepID=A0ABT0UX13_9ACTN|nr:hypothetical protein [Streptomyces sp. CWNU-1]MCM2393118.1 hypothetical protein [Streptomyces sp. CWNU-1]
MSGTDPDLAVPPGALELIASGIDKAYGELKDLGLVGDATAHRGFADLALSGLDLGHRGLSEEFKTFCRRWEWGVRGLMQRGNGFARELGLSAGASYEQEQYRKDSFKIGLNSLNGNPHLSEDEVTKKSWDEIRNQAAWDNPDYSAESFSKAHDEVKQTWQDTTYDVNDALMDSMTDSGVIDPRFREALEVQAQETYDPSEEAVQRAREGDGG